MIYGGLSTVSTPSLEFQALVEHPREDVRNLVLIMLAEGLAYQQIDVSLVVAAEAIGLNARLIADECVRQLNEMPSLERH